MDTVGENFIKLSQTNRPILELDCKIKLVVRLQENLFQYLVIWDMESHFLSKPSQKIVLKLEWISSRRI